MRKYAYSPLIKKMFFSVGADSRSVTRNPIGFIHLGTKPFGFNMKLKMFRIFPTKSFFALRNIKKGFVAEGSYPGYTVRTIKGFVDFFILFLKLWTPLDAF